MNCDICFSRCTEVVDLVLNDSGNKMVFSVPVPIVEEAPTEIKNKYWVVCAECRYAA